MRKIRRMIALLCATILLSGNWCMSTFAAEADTNKIMELETSVEGYDFAANGIMPYSTTFVNTSINVTFSTSGMYVTIHTGMNNTASVVGVKDIVVQRKSGNDWVTVATAAGGEASDISACAVSFTYPDTKSGQYYRVCCTHYGNVDEYREAYHETGELKCTVTSTAS